jgi:acetolactate synthase-1/3 small subunit/acetolactate synthase II small subunit
MGRLVIGFRPDEGAVGRIVGLCERRGFELKGISMSGSAPDASLTLDLRARDAGRRLDVLDLQLRRLAEVGSVSIFPQAPGTPS